jgi:flagellar basal body rod protein FlgF
MSYLSDPASKTGYGVVVVGDHINVDVNGIISVPQDLSPTANITFNAGSFTTLTANGQNVVTSVTPNAGAGISLTSVQTNGYAAAFTVNNTGVVSVASNDGIALSGSTGNISISNTGVLRLAGSPGIGLSSASGNVTVTNTGVVSLSANDGIALSGSTGNIAVSNTGVLRLSTGPGISVSAASGNVVLNNTGVLRLTAGTGIAISSNTGNIVVSTTGTSYINTIGVNTNYSPTLTDEYIGVYSGSAVTISLPVGIEGRVYIIKDEYGQNSGKITLQPQANVLIDGKLNYIISVPYQSVQTVYRSGGWWII